MVCYDTTITERIYQPTAQAIVDSLGLNSGNNLLSWSVFVTDGMDTVLSMPRWKDPDALIGEFRIVAITRPGFDESKLSALSVEGLDREIEVVVADTPDISSSQIRKDLASSKADVLSMDTLYLPVRRFIKDHDLYK